MLFSSPEARSLLANRHRRTPCVLLLDTSWSMEGEKISRLNAGFRAFRDDILRNPMAAQSVELCVISFGPVTVQSEFALLREMAPLQLEADGITPLKHALELAMLKVTERKQTYREHGISSYRPWIFLLTDGEPTDDEGVYSNSYRTLLQPLQLAATEKKFTLFTIGIDVSEQGREVLSELSRPFGGRCLDLANLKFEEMFLWLSGSLSRVSQSAPGEAVQLVDPRSGDDLYDGWVL
ncbi:VWA domain-containing protein [Synechococcus sp. CCY9201]|uniref:vWA domain-containing protein n=1 Tax=Synechococcus sp. CCY9201 TaxID=174697 RepID=UPI002B1EABBA|nr:VWA domain-containing protein [Synechococcus sp. CCY9201]MEA5474286.1 VWA domain-containing protein [Synechococcus sp. CCY9201]